MDYQSKIADMREEWEIKEAEKLTKPEGEDADDYDEYTPSVHNFFRASSKGSPRLNPGAHGSDTSDGVVSNEKVAQDV